MIEHVLARIEKRLLAVGLKAAQASKQAGLSPDAIRNLRRGAKGDLTRHGASTRTINMLAPVLRTTPGWLMDGIGEEEERHPSYIVPIMGYVGALALVEPEYERVPSEGLEQIELPFSIPAEMIAFLVRGDSMLPVYHDGDAVIVYRNQSRPTESFIGEEVVVQTVDGRRYLKTIMHGAGRSITLASFNARPLDEVDVTWVGEIFCIIRASQVRKMNMPQQEARDREIPDAQGRVFATLRS